MPKKKSPREGRRHAAGGKAPHEQIAVGADYSEAAAAVDGRLPVVFLALGLVLGTLYAWLMPPMQVPDEMMHFARVYSVSRGVCVASPDIDMPRSFAQLNDLFPHWLELRRKISNEDLRQGFEIPLNDRDMAGNGRARALDGFINQNVYFCAPYWPEAAVLSVGRAAAVGPLALMYLCRMTNLVCYVGLTFLALRLLPDFRMILFCLALMPMALQQAASVSGDATVIAVSFVYAAYVLRLAFGGDAGRLGIREYAVLALLIAFLVLSKSLICAVFLLLLIPAGRFPSRAIRWSVVGAYLLLAILCVLTWQHVNQANMQRLAEEWVAQGYDPDACVRFMREHPAEVGWIFARHLMDPSYLYHNLQQFVGSLGWMSVQVPDWLVWLYFALLAGAAATQTRAVRLNWAARVVLLLFAAAAVGSMLTVGWIGSTPKLALEHLEVWEKYRIPMQGRYWIPFALPMLVLFSTGRTRFHPRYFAVAAEGVVVLASAVSLVMVRSTYYR